MNELYEKAKKAMMDGNEEEAKSFLLKRNNDKENLKKVLKLCAEEKERMKVMETNVNELQKRALEVEALLQRSVGAKARENSFDFTLSTEDPILKKFKDIG